MTQKSAAVLHVQPLDDSETAWLATVRASAADAGLNTGIGSLSEYFDLERLWCFSEPRSRGGAAGLVNAVAIALGDALVSTLQMRWVMVSSQTSSELAVASDEGKVVVYPVKAVERCLTREFDVTIEEYFDSVVRKVDGIRARPRLTDLPRTPRPGGRSPRR